MQRAGPVARSVLSDLVKEHLLEAIMAGVYPPGSRIVETQVARELGTSQAPVREALRDLEGLGIVELAAFRGARVRHPSRDELLEAYGVRTELETYGARLALRRISDADLAELEDKVRAESERIYVDRDEQLAAVEARLQRRRDYFTSGKDKGFDEDDDFWGRGLSTWAEEQALPPLEDARALVGGLFVELVPKITTEDSKKIRELVRNAAIRDDRKLAPREFESIASAAVQVREALAPLYKELAKATGSKKGAVTKHINRIVEGLLEQTGFCPFGLYHQDYGGPIGFRIAAKHPDWVEALIIQNTNAYAEGLSPLFEHLRPLWEKRTGVNEWRVTQTFKRAGTIWQYTHGVSDRSKVSPDAWNMDQYFLDQPHSHFIQLELQTDFGSNVKRYPEWHEYFRKYQPPTLVVWGKNDAIFSQKGAEMYKRDLKDIEGHFLDTGHFALRGEWHFIAVYLGGSLEARNLKKLA